MMKPWHNQEIEDGCTIEAIRRVYSPWDGGRIARNGKIMRVRERSYHAGALALYVDGGYSIYSSGQHSTPNHDLTENFRVVKDKKKMTVAEIEEKLGYGVEVVRG